MTHTQEPTHTYVQKPVQEARILNQIQNHTPFERQSSIIFYLCLISQIKSD